MPASPEDLFAYLAALGVDTETIDHPPLFTVEDSRTLRGDIPGGHTKNLFVKDKKNRLFLLQVAGTSRELAFGCRRRRKQLPTRDPPPSAFLMPASPEDLLAYLAGLGVETETIDHPPLFTVEDSRTLRGDIPGGHTKNLFVKDKKNRLFLLV